MFEINYSQLIQYEILEKLVTYIGYFTGPLLKDLTTADLNIAALESQTMTAAHIKDAPLYILLLITGY